MVEIPLTIAGAAKALRAGELSSVALTTELFSRADHFDSKIGCYIVRTEETALEAAAAADARFRDGIDLGPLQGIPLGVKDILATNEAPTTAQSLVLDRAWGDRGDGPVVARLRAAGAVLMGKVTTMEFACGLPDPAKPFPVPRNPWNTDNWTGGSSSGTGNGVAAGLFLGGLGTDTGGSVRIPAAFCGITGMKQTYGRVPKSGCVPLGYSYDHIGPMARSAEDCAIMLQVMAGYDASDPTCADLPVPDYLAGLNGSLKGMRIGVEKAYHLGRPDVEPGVASAIDASLTALAAAGAEIAEVTIPHFEAISTGSSLSIMGEPFAYHLPDLRARWADYGYLTSQSIAVGALLNAADYVQGQRVRSYARKVVATLFEGIDALVTPTAAMEAPPLAALTDAGWFWSCPIYTAFWNVVGYPALSVPMGFGQTGLPLGLQVVTKPFDEATGFKIGDAYQRLTDFHLQVPEMAMAMPA